jgi:hypothetical protein
MNQNGVSDDNNEINFNILNDVNLSSNKYEYTYENYIIIFDIQNNNLMIEIQNKLNSEKYKNHYTQNELIEINKIFSMFDNIEESIKEIELNKNNFSINISDNLCILTIKIDTNELPKNKISDTIIFKIPLIELKPEKNNSNMSQINKNLKCLKIENNISIESINNASPRDSIKFNNNTNADNIQILMAKIDKLSQENKEIKERLNVLEENNNKLINLIKESRINLLKEKNNSDNPLLISPNKKNDNIKFNFGNNPDFDFLSFSFQNDSQNDKSNILKNLYSNFLKNKKKSKDKIEDELFNKKNKNESTEKNAIYKPGRKKSNFSKNSEDNYFYSNKEDVDIIDDVGFFKNYKLTITPSSENLIRNNQEEKNIMCLDELEEERKNPMRKNESNGNEDDWSVNKSYNMVGVTCLKDKNKNKKMENFNLIGNNIPKKESNDENEYLF